MMELMEVQPPPPPPPPNANGFDEFLQTGRTGRRNAVPDIEPPEGDETKLPSAIEKLTCSEPSSQNSDKSEHKGASSQDMSETGQTTEAMTSVPADESNNLNSSQTEMGT